MRAYIDENVQIFVQNRDGTIGLVKRRQEKYSEPWFKLDDSQVRPIFNSWNTTNFQGEEAAYSLLIGVFFPHYAVLVILTSSPPPLFLSLPLF